MRLFLGLDCSTQSLTAVVLEVEGERKQIAFEASLDFDNELPHYGTRHGVLPDADARIGTAPPLMWVEALDRVMDRVAHCGLPLEHLAAVSGSAQQHGSVYLNAQAGAGLAALDSSRPLVGQIAPMLARPTAPIWMDTSTTAECEELARAVGGPSTLAAHTGSRAFERFTAAQIRKFAKQDPAAYRTTDRIHLVSSFLASLLAGTHAPVDPGDGSGMNLMDLQSRAWWPAAIDATAPGLLRKLPAIAPSSATVGPLAAYWRDRYGLPPARAIVWSGDNPCSLIGIGLVAEGRAGISLGTSDTIFGVMAEPRVDPLGTGHVFGSPTGAFMGLTCFKNGSLARERIRDRFGLSWPSFSEALDRTPPGNLGRLLIPWFEPEITPAVVRPGVRRLNLAEDDLAGNVRAIVEAQQMALALHSRWMGVDIREIHATGGASENRAILQVMADVFGADVRPFEIANSAALGAALRAYHAYERAEGRAVGWEAVVSGIVKPGTAGRLRPDPNRHAIYKDLKRVYESFERAALRGT